ncbi:MAG: hypothetical protein O3A00_00855 [Planctomycetota bacterium]|nr:hypothetical protein [Planctomycetota bacterium]
MNEKTRRARRAFAADAMLSDEERARKCWRRHSTTSLVNFQMVITSLSELSEADISGTPEGRFALAVLKSVGEHQPLGWTEFEEILAELCEEDEDQLSRILTRAWS